MTAEEVAQPARVDGAWSPRPRAWLTALLLVGTAAALVAPTFQFPTRWADPYDWRYFEATEEVFRVAAVEYHQAPLWNPFMCGGEVALANPQSTWASPTFLLTMIFGTALGLKLALLLLLLAALDGGYRLGRELGLSYPGALVCGISYGCCGWFAMHLSSGHINFAGAALYPHLVLGYRMAARGRPGGYVIAAAAVAWMIGLGGTYTAPMGAVLLGVWAASDAAAERRIRPLAVALGVGLLAAALSAARFLPVLEFVRDHPRHVAERDGNDALDLLRSLFAWRQKLEPVDGHTYWWHEYCCHLPYLGCALAVLGALRAPGQRLTRLKLAPTAIVAVWTILALCLPGPELWLERHLIGYADVYHLAVTAAIWLALAGDRGSIGRRFAPILIVSFGIFAGVRWPHGPWWVIRHLPLYADLRVPSRYLILAALPLTMWAGLGLDVLTARLSARHLRRLPGWLTTPRIGALALAAILVEGLAFSTPTWLGIFTVLYQTPTLKRPFHQEDGDIRWMFSGVLQNFGTLKCDEEAPLQRGDLDKGTVESGTEQARLDDPSAGSARQVDWTPNQVTVEVDLQRPTEVLVNQNWNEHWRSSDAEVIAVAGRLAFRGVPGKRTVVLRYRPRSFVVGAWVSAGAALLGLGLLALELRRRRR